MKIKLNNQLKDEAHYKWVIWIDDDFSKEDLNIAEDFGLTVGKENWYKPDMRYIIGTAQQIIDFCKATNPDKYGDVTIEEIENVSTRPMAAIRKINDKKVKDAFEANLKKLIKEEEEAIASYEHEIENAQSSKIDKLLRHIQAEEQEHLRELKAALKGEFRDSKKSIKDYGMNVRRLRSILENALSLIENLDDDIPVNVQSNTYRIGVPFIGTYDGYIDLENIIDEEKIEDMLVQWIYEHYNTRKDALAHIKEIENNAPVSYEYDIEDLINEMPDFEDSVNDSAETKKFNIAYTYTEDYKNSKVYMDTAVIEAKDEEEAKEKLEAILDKNNKVLKKIIDIGEL